MARLLRASSKVLALLLFGAVVGPIVFAAVGSAITASQSDDSDNHAEYERLVDAYRARLPKHVLFTTIREPSIEQECGYASEALFPDFDQQFERSLKEGSFTPYAGYFALGRWRRESVDEEWIAAITKKISAKMSLFEAGFLRRCIEGTLLTESCMARVKPYGDDAMRFDHDRKPLPWVGWGIEREIICTYSDGVAAREGIPLSKWEDSKERN